MMPVRMRINTDLIRTIFKKGDQRILANFEGISLPDITDSASEEPKTLAEDLQISMLPSDGNKEAFDFNISLYDPDLGNYLGL